MVKRGSPTGLQLVFMMVVTGICLFLGITPLLGAFVAGMVASLATEDRSHSRAAIKNFSFAFFVPIYFASSVLSSFSSGISTLSSSFSSSLSPAP